MGYHISSAQQNPPTPHTQHIWLPCGSSGSFFRGSRNKLIRQLGLQLETLISKLKAATGSRRITRYHPCTYLWQLLVNQTCERLNTLSGNSVCSWHFTGPFMRDCNGHCERGLRSCSWLLPLGPNLSPPSRATIMVFTHA